MPEEQAFCVLVKIMYDYGLRELYKNNFEDLHCKFYQLERLMQVKKNHKIIKISIWYLVYKIGSGYFLGVTVVGISGKEIGIMNGDLCIFLFFKNENVYFGN